MLIVLNILNTCIYSIPIYMYSRILYIILNTLYIYIHSIHQLSTSNICIHSTLFYHIGFIEYMYP